MLVLKFSVKKVQIKIRYFLQIWMKEGGRTQKHVTARIFLMSTYFGAIKADRLCPPIGLSPLILETFTLPDYKQTTHSLVNMDLKISTVLF